jgi:methyltransferase (TIGR00027 family)
MQLHHFPNRYRHCFALLAVVLVSAIIGIPESPAMETGQLSVTAEGTAATRAIFNLHPDEKIRNDDHMAMELLHPEYWHYSLMTDDFEKCMKVIKTFRMVTNYYVNARTKHMDAIVKQAALEGIEQVVNLGAGYDSRAYRFHRAMPGVKFFEIELPAMVNEKKRRVKSLLGGLPDYVTYVPIDFNSQTIPGELTKAGYSADRKTMFIWEGVTYYISEEAVNGTLEFITAAAPGSSVVFDYMPLGVVEKRFDKYPDMRMLSFWVAHKGEPFIFGIPEGKGIDYFQKRGLKVVSDIGPKELETRYLTGSDGSLVGPCASGFRIMHATVPAK